MASHFWKVYSKFNMPLNDDAWKVLAWVANQTKVVGEKARMYSRWAFIFLGHWHIAGTLGLGDCYPLIFNFISKSLVYPKIQRRQRMIPIWSPNFLLLCSFWGKHLTGGCSFWFLPFLTLSSSVSLTVITSNGNKVFGIASVTSQRIVK